MDKIDIKILDSLQKNSDITINEIANLVSLSTTPCWKRINKLKGDGYIKKTVALLDNKKLGLDVKVCIFVTIDNHSIENIELLSKVVKQMPEIMECYRMGGTVDYLLKVLVQDIAGYDKFYKKFIKNIHSINVTSNFVIETIKETSELPLTAD